MKIHPKHWNFEKQRGKRGSAHEMIVNGCLNNLSARIASIFMDLVSNRTPPTPALLREQLQQQNEPLTETATVIRAGERKVCRPALT